MGRFKDKTVLITGASSGIGRVLALDFAKEGAKVVVTARRKERLTQLAEEIESLGQSALAISCDVTSDEDLAQAVKQTNDAFGAIDVTIANAGFGVVGHAEQLTIDDYKRQFETNTYGVIRTYQATIQDLKQTRGRFVLVGSVAGYVCFPGTTPYAMSKAAVISFAQGIYHECRPHGVSVTLISPGFVDSEIRKVDNDGTYDETRKDTASAWLTMPTDVASRKIVRAIYKRKREAIITGHGKFLQSLSRHFPRITNWLISKAPDQTGHEGTEGPSPHSHNS